MAKIKAELVKPLDGEPIGAEREFSEAEYKKLAAQGAVKRAAKPQNKAAKKPANKTAPRPDNKSAE